jgi:23S rRNA (uracil1939-C5)-methyltransferase
MISVVQRSDLFVVTVQGLSPEGLGIADINGRRLVVPGALPGERVKVRLRRRGRRREQGVLIEVLESAPERVQPCCPHFGVCGGCTLQHMDPVAQLALKEQHLREQFWQHGQLQAEAWLPPVFEDPWGYRRRARLGARFVEKKNRVLVGYRETRGHFVADLSRCVTLHPLVGERIALLRDFLNQLAARRHIPQIEVAVGEADVALVIRHLVEMNSSDRGRLIAFARAQAVHIYLQPGGPDTLTPLWPAEAKPLRYRLSDWGLELQFMPGDFLQINGAVNQSLVSLAVALLAPEKHERMLDLYCGLGNFTLPFGGLVGEIVGLERCSALVHRAQQNARRNAIGNAQFHQADLASATECEAWLQQSWQKLLVDPPRSGCPSLVGAPGIARLSRLLYVSCNPETLARDANVLVRQQGFRLARAGLVDMFPHTNQAEAVALFVRGARG